MSGEVAVTCESVDEKSDVCVGDPSLNAGDERLAILGELATSVKSSQSSF